MQNKKSSVCLYVKQFEYFQPYLAPSCMNNNLCLKSFQQILIFFFFYIFSFNITNEIKPVYKLSN
jgi:hypothetical protein